MDKERVKVFLFYHPNELEKMEETINTWLRQWDYKIEVYRVVTNVWPFVEYSGIPVAIVQIYFRPSDQYENPELYEEE